MSAAPTLEEEGEHPPHGGQVEHMVERYLGVADAVANRHRYPGHDPEDLRQVARLGLLVAIRRYREGAGQGFVPYAVPTITGMIKRYVRDQSWVVRPPRPIQELRLEVNAVSRRLTAELGREPDRKEIAAAAGLSEDKVDEAQLGAAAMVGLPIDQPATQGHSAVTGRVLTSIETGYEDVEQKQVLAAALTGLTERERQLLRLRFIEEMSQSEIAEILGVSQMQVSRLLRQLLDRLRRKVA
ncbi:sigma-70 family RNA polymerase sigma factor [Sinomonas sp.]|uniref:sigma-70 family RNA polymerase sigma factor n=1 Tax=Sinomonas sp. TaxID=1914986 RepID=UPI002C13B10C|nr:sigma-70 family RNA polymerase sigma factor [Sinomonas sp.]